MGTEVGTGVGFLVGFTDFGGFVGLTGQTGGGVGQMVGLKGHNVGEGIEIITGDKVG